jgi:thrombospondin type 3 repeat protein
VRCSIVTILLSSALVACGSVGTHAGEACDATTPCTDGQVCDLTAPGGAVCLDGAGDLDGDGIPNSMDHCQHMAGGLYDEDGDGIGDECDACPIAKPLAMNDPNKDTDNDGVDYPCDPNPHADGEKIVLFNGFNGTALPDKWTTSAAGVWQIQGGEAIMTPTTPTESEILKAPLAGSTTHTVLFAGYRIDTAGTTDADAAVTGITDLPMGASMAVCGGSRVAGTDYLRLNTDGGAMQKPFMGNLFDTAGAYRVLEQLDGATAKCALQATAASDAVQTMTGGLALTSAGLVAHGAKTRFQYLLVVQR